MKRFLQSLPVMAGLAVGAATANAQFVDVTATGFAGAFQYITQTTGPGTFGTLTCFVINPMTGSPFFWINIVSDGAAIYSGPMYSFQNKWVPFFFAARTGGVDGSQLNDVFQVPINATFKNSFYILASTRSPGTNGALLCFDSGSNSGPE